MATLADELEARWQEYATALKAKEDIDVATAALGALLEAAGRISDEWVFNASSIPEADGSFQLRGDKAGVPSMFSFTAKMFSLEQLLHLILFAQKEKEAVS